MKAWKFTENWLFASFYHGQAAKSWQKLTRSNFLDRPWNFKTSKPKLDLAGPSEIVKKSETQFLTGPAKNFVLSDVLATQIVEMGSGDQVMTFFLYFFLLRQSFWRLLLSKWRLSGFFLVKYLAFLAILWTAAIKNSNKVRTFENISTYKYWAKL